MLTRRKLFTFYLITSAFLITSCNDDDGASIEDFDEVVTQNDAEYWAAENPTTYYLEETIRWLEDPDGTGNSNPAITRNYDLAILNSIKSNMTILGYTRVEQIDQDNLPDLIMSAQALATTSANIEVIWDQWYDWWGYYNPYYPGGLYPIYYEYTEGTVFIEMGVTDTLNEDDRTIDIVWGAGINGLVRDSQQGNIDFIEQRISNAFNESSSYLRN